MVGKNVTILKDIRKHGDPADVSGMASLLDMKSKTIWSAQSE